MNADIGPMDYDLYERLIWMEGWANIHNVLTDQLVASVGADDDQLCKSSHHCLDLISVVVLSPQGLWQRLCTPIGFLLLHWTFFWIRDICQKRKSRWSSNILRHGT